MLVLEKGNKMEKVYHYPVMWKEVIDNLPVADSEYIIDCTAGMGGHAYKMLSAGKKSFYVGIDKDSQSLEETYCKLRPFKGRFVLLQDNFKNMDAVCQEMRIEKADVIFFDLGLSSCQLLHSGRGFSFLKEEFLDMRLDPDAFVTAADLVNNLSQEELVEIFKKFGEERYSKRIGQKLIEQRRERPILQTTQLVRIIEKSVPAKARFGRIHPATRIFQALRIAVNRELESLREALPRAVARLKKRGRIGVISFHSLEDRIVKHTFKDFSSRGLLKIITKKPLFPSETEKKINPSSRSAKLRIAEKVN